VLDRAAAILASELPAAPHDDTQPLPAILLSRYQAGDAVLSLFSTIAAFGSAEDVSLADLRIELMFPADETTRQALLAAAQP
jgi:hypothetical protein